jgi:GTP-binding protein HflX
LPELAALASTAGLRVVECTYQKLRQANPATFIGQGKVEEIKFSLLAKEAGIIIFDEELTPAQQRNLENSFGDGIKVIDRTALILDIFAQHAHTREGQIQVELAQYEYRLPRLTRMWEHLARQAGARAAGSQGGVGLRGPGEKQLEADRRQIRKKITYLKKELEQVKEERRQRHEHRRRSGIKVIALTGYTNAGKSSLLNALCHAGVLVEDKLFATLDPTTRRVKLPAGRIVLFTDTVGFIKKLPHHLVVSFRATFEGISQADLILHIADIAHNDVHAQIAVVEKALEEQNTNGKPILLVWNKIDLLPKEVRLHLLEDKNLLAVSTSTGEGMDRLLLRIEDTLNRGFRSIEMELPYSQWELVHTIYEMGTIYSIQHGEAKARVKACVPDALFPRLKPFTCSTGFR